MSNKRKKNPTVRFLKTFLLTIVISVTALFVITNFIDIPARNKPADVAPNDKSNITQHGNNGNPNEVVSTASLTSIGDLLIHAPVFKSVEMSDGSYDFTSIFRYVKPYINADYNVANLEVSLGGTDNGM